MRGRRLGQSHPCPDQRDSRSGVGYLGGVKVLLLIAAVAAAQAPEAVSPTRGCLASRTKGVVIECRRALQDDTLSRSRRATLLRVVALRLAWESRWLEVADSYIELIATTPEDASAHRDLGEVLLRALGRPEDALAALSESRRLDPDDAETHGLMAAALNALGRPVDAIRAYEEALRIDPGYLAARPAARKSFAASEQGLKWPEDATGAPREQR